MGGNPTQDPSVQETALRNCRPEGQELGPGIDQSDYMRDAEALDATNAADESESAAG